jgi:uncharacterized membrane protein YkvA (DUF1232 family)
MNTKAIRRKIEEAIAHEKDTETLAGILHNHALFNGRHVKIEEIKGAVDCICGYVEHAALLLEQLEAASESKEVSITLKPILVAAEQYFLAPADIIPDHLGLVGLMDDAFLVHKLVQSILDRHQQETGTPLLPLNPGMSKVNQQIRMCIGEPMASQLDMIVQATLGMPTFQQVLDQLRRFNGSLPLGADPMWGNAGIDEIVNARLGAIGIV